MPFGDWNTSEYWDATANKPKLTSGKGIHGQGYLVGTSGSTNLDGNTGWQVGDIAIFLLDKWVRVSASGAGGSANPAGADGDIQTKSGTSLAAIARAGGLATDYLARDNSYKPFSGGGGTFTGTGDPGLTRAQHMLTSYTTPPNAIRTTGYDTNDDNGEGLYVKVSSEPDHAGKFQTADLTWYELKHDGRVFPAQFGAKSNTPDNWNARTNDIGPYLNMAVDYIVFNRFGVCDLHIHGGFYYQTVTCQLKGASFNVRGVGKGGTFIMPQEYVTGFVGHHNSFSFETFGGGYGWRQFAVGETFYTPGGIPGTASAHCYVCTQAGTTSSDGSQKPTGTGTNYTDGTCKFDYYREATRVELLNGGGNAWSGELSNLSLYSHFDGTATLGVGFGAQEAQIHAPAVGPWPQFPHGRVLTAGPWKPSFGFLGRVRAHVHHVDMSGFSAHGCAFIANGDQDFPTITGNINFWCVTDSSFYYNAMDGLHIAFSDGNAGYSSHIDVSGNGRWGIRDQSFLGNMYQQVQSARDGVTSLTGNKLYPASVAYSGYRYNALLGHVGTTGIPDWGATAPTPGASNSAWGLIGTGVTDNWDYPDWVSGYHYEPSGCYGSDCVDARNVWNSVYIEGGSGLAQWNARDVVIGGLKQSLYIGAGENLLDDGVWYNRIVYGSRQHSFSATLGSGGTYEGVGEGILNWYDGDNNRIYGLRSDTYETGQTWATSNWMWAIDRFGYGYWIKAGQTTKFYGEPTALSGGQFSFHSLYVGSDGDCRKLDFADSKPTDGTGGRGARVYNRQADVGQVEGWICCGTGRVWKNMRTIT